ncbi:hypothetical protein [Chryseobacterium piperi]|nr:hypothetical protein [Chryseobacterium piperi]
MKTKPNISMKGYSTVIAGSLLFLSACQTDNTLESDLDHSSLKNLTVSKNAFFQARQLDLPEEKIYLYPEDKNYEMIDMGRYALGKVLKDLIDENILSIVVNYAKNTGEKTVSFEKIFNMVPSLKDQINEKLASQNLPNCPYDFSNYDNIQSIMSRNGIDYGLGLYIYNLDNNPGVNSFILTPGTELEDEANAEDQVMGWYKDPATSISPIKISEVEAKTYATLGTFTSIDLIPGIVLGPGGGTTPINPTPVIKNIYIRQVNIHYRYEKSGKSEVYMHALKNTGGNNWNGTFGSNWPANDYSKHLTSTKSTNQWVTVDKGQYLFPNTITTVWNTFERDWYAGFKPVSNLNGATTYQQSGAPMTFADEWYALIPSSNNLSNNKSMGPLKAPIVNNGTNNTYVQGEWNKFEANFYAQ